ncbi:MAG: hypothetical protein COT43_07460 [Candidatus Marinimicrobia bacterium CG08_land_8_20_14_0_20_45_22]|nr:MAG: hypothetical protein COT43_07460 [Candidatus Marinimicrobia bacterium CG08_land_8_20_14_0_20_45_22]
MPSNNLKAKKSMSTILLLVIVFCATSCRECPTEPDNDIYLAVEDIFCTSITLKVTLPDSDNENQFALERNDSTILTLTCYDDDTLITDEDLTPDTDYTYRVRFLKDGKTKAESDPITVHTMDTTSHYFVWEIDTLGLYGSYLNDVWIVNENDVWVVGNIETDSGTFNAARWDGKKWEPLKVLSGYTPNYGILYFSEKDIWVTSGLPQHWDGKIWTLFHLWNMGILGNNDGGVEHIWASSPTDIYFVGRKGSIVHYDGSTFTKIESGTDVDLLDIWGLNSQSIWAVGEDNGYFQSVLLYFNGTTWEQIYYDNASVKKNNRSLYGHFRTVWVWDDDIYLGGSAGIWHKTINYSDWDLTRDIDIISSGIFERKIRGNQNNDIILVGNNKTVVHYNGVNWKIVMERSAYNDLLSIDIKNDIIIAVGNTLGLNGLVLRGHR